LGGGDDGDGSALSGSVTVVVVVVEAAIVDCGGVKEHVGRAGPEG